MIPKKLTKPMMSVTVVMTTPPAIAGSYPNFLKKCGSIEEMCFPEALKQVKGLGEVKRKRIVEVLTSEEPIQVERTVRRR